MYLGSDAVSCPVRHYDESLTRPGGEKKSLTYYTKMAYDVSYNAIYNKYSKAVQKFIKRPALAWCLLALAAVLMGFS